VTRSRAAAQAGFTMIEVLLAMILSMLVLGVTVTAFTGMMDDDRAVTEHNEAQETARIAMDRMARELRNLASPTVLTTITENRPRAVERADAFDLIARIVDDNPVPAGSSNSSNLMRVRYCLNAADPQNATIWYQTQRWTSATPPAVPESGSCPSAAWGNQRGIATNVTNVIDPDAQRALFTYDSTDLDKVTRVHSDVYVDPTPTERPVEARVSSGVLLRNQNQYPVAGFTMTVIGTSGTSKIVRLDGSTSVDPESQGLKYCWWVNPPTPIPVCKPEDATWVKPASYRDQGVVASVTLNTTSRVVLTVEDPAGLRDEETKTWMP
jgi:type II secretory pathway pseudopilin PulG